MELANMIGIGAGVLTAVSMLPQVVKIFKEKKANDLSPVMIVMLLFGLGLWIWYGSMKNDLPILLTNIFSAAVNLTLLGGFIWCKKSKDR